MYLHEKEILIPAVSNHTDLLNHFQEVTEKHLPSDDMPVRFVVTKTDEKGYHCELGILSGINDKAKIPENSIFDFRPRAFENTDKFNAVLLVPTGVGAEIGGHSGDAGPVARLLASACDNLITHPNVVNAADINELPENGLYVEGSVITRLMMGTLGLQKVRSNRVLLVIDKHDDKFFYEEATNAISAARAAMGLDCPGVVMMEDKILMHSLYSNSGRAVGKIDYFERVCDVLNEYRDKYDAVAMSSVIKVPQNFHKDYYLEDMLNPWGGVEAMLTHTISLLFDVPSAHSPMLETKEILDIDLGIIDPRKAAEIVSVTFLHSILKGLHRSPRIISDPSAFNHPGLITAKDVSCVVIPYGCLGLPVLAAMEHGIPVIAVKENTNRMQNMLEDFPFKSGKLFIVENYLEAVGVMHALRSGVALETVRRPLKNTLTSDYKAQDITRQESDVINKSIPDIDIRKKKKAL